MPTGQVPERAATAVAPIVMTAGDVKTQQARVSPRDWHTAYLMSVCRISQYIVPGSRRLLVNPAEIFCPRE